MRPENNFLYTTILTRKEKVGGEGGYTLDSPNDLKSNFVLKSQQQAGFQKRIHQKKIITLPNLKGL